MYPNRTSILWCQSDIPQSEGAFYVEVARLIELAALQAVLVVPQIRDVQLQRGLHFPYCFSVLCVSVGVFVDAENSL